MPKDPLLNHALIAIGATLNTDDELPERTLYDWSETAWDMVRIDLPLLPDASEASFNEHLDHLTVLIARHTPLKLV